MSLVAARFVQALAAPIVALVIEVLSWIFWLAAWACAAATLHGSGGFGGYHRATRGALVAFGVLEWYVSVFSSLFAGFWCTALSTSCRFSFSVGGLGICLEFGVMGVSDM